MTESEQFYEGLLAGMLEQEEQEKCAEAFIDGLIAGMEPSPVDKLASLLQSDDEVEEVEEPQDLSARLKSLASRG